jgi:UDP-N-acetylmuramate--alanine ligase
MHIYFSGIGGAAIGPLALIAHQAGFSVSGSDKQQSRYIEYLASQGVTDVHIGQEYDQIAKTHQRQPIDWFVYTSALPMEQPDAPELRFCADNSIRATKRDEFLSALLEQKNLKMIAIAGTHGKTTTTAMSIWLCKQLGMPISYSVGAKMSFGDMGEYDPDSQYFVYEADEFDRNFLSFQPALSIITGIDWDHPDIYPTQEIYDQAFVDFLQQSGEAVLWDEDLAHLHGRVTTPYVTLSKHDDILKNIHLAGKVNRENALQVATAFHKLTGKPLDELIKHLETFPGVGRRFEQIAPGLYSDYAHTVPKMYGALQLARETAGQRPLVVVYEGLHNTRQHFIKDELRELFRDADQLYIVPSYLAREDASLALLSPEDLKNLMAADIQAKTTPAALDNELAAAISNHLEANAIVLCLTAGGGGSLDEWLRGTFA